MNTAYITPEFVEHGSFVTRTLGAGSLVTQETTGLNANTPNAVETSPNNTHSSPE